MLTLDSAISAERCGTMHFTEVGERGYVRYTRKYYIHPAQSYFGLQIPLKVHDSSCVLLLTNQK